jgi:serine/threonine protein kinase
MMETQTFGRYEIKEKLGKGGMATVYLASDPNFGRDVAIKVLPRQFLHDEQFRGRFEREAKTIAALEHKAIVPVYDFGEHDGQPYLVMRYMPGGALDSRIRQGAVAPSEAAKIITRIASALDAAHQRGIVHRDLKPGNVLFDADGDAYLSDFGIVKVTEATANLTGNAIIGTPAYMSPEQVHGDRDIDGRSDIYTLGVILYEMLTGQVPYPAKTPTQQMMAHVLDPVPEVTTARRDLSPVYNTVVQKGMAKDPSLRYQTAGALAEAFNTAVGQQSDADIPLSALADEETDKTTVMPTPVPLAQTITDGGSEPSDTQLTPTPFGMSGTEAQDQEEEADPAVAAARSPFPDLTTDIEAESDSGGGGGTAKKLLLGCLAVFIGGFVLIGICVVGLIGIGLLADTDPTPTPELVAATPMESSVRLDEVVDQLLDEPTVEPTEPVIVVEEEPTIDPTVEPVDVTDENEDTDEDTSDDYLSELFVSFDNEEEWATGELTGPDGEFEASALMQDGEMVLTAALPDYIFWATAGENLGDGFYFVDTVAISGPLDNGYGLMLFTDTELDNFYRFQISSDGYVLVTYCEDGCDESTPLVDNGWFPSDAINQGLGELNALNVDAIDGTLSFFVNGELVAEAEYEGDPTGDVGFIVDTQNPEDQSPVVIAFDNFDYFAWENEDE